MSQEPKEWELAEIAKRPRPKKKDIEIDMNPMVDLAFLLLTFFMLTTTFKQPQAMEIFYPIDADKANTEEQKVKESKTLTILLAGGDSIVYYQGITNPVVEFSSYRANGLRQLLFEKNKAINGLIVLLKPMPNCTYQNFVDALDELTITDIKRYSILDPETTDYEAFERAKNYQ